MRKSIQCELVSWDQVASLSYELASQISRSGFKPDLVIAIARGGYVPARLLCDYLNIYKLTSIRVEHYTAGANKTEQARLVMPLLTSLEGQSVLLVDDVDDTGETLKLAVDYLRQLKPDQIKVAVLHHKKVSCLMPDYYGQEQADWRWLTYPWAVTEDVKGFMARLDPLPASITEIQQQLNSEFGMEVTIDVLKRILSLDQ